MKARISIFIVLLCLSLPAMSQTIYTVGMKGGLNVSTLGQFGTIYTTKLGYHVGVYASIQSYQEIGMQIELQVSQQGARIEGISNSSLNYTYFAIPAFLNFFFIETASIEVGLQPAYLVRAVQVDEGDKFDINEDVRNFDLSGVIGFNYNQSYGSIGIRYLLGVTNTNRASLSAENKFRNKVLQLYISKTIFSKQ